MIHTLSLWIFLHRIITIITKTVQKNTTQINKIVFIPGLSETAKINKHFWKRNILHIKYPEISKSAHSNLYLISHYQSPQNVTIPEKLQVHFYATNLGVKYMWT